MHSRSSSTPAALTTHQDPLDSESTNTGTHLRPRTVPPMSMAATKISRFFIIFTALLLDKIAGYKAKETRTTTGRLTRPELTSDLNNFLSKGPIPAGDSPTETDQANWKKRTSKETATAQQPRDQDLHHSRHFFDHDYTGFDGAFAHTLKETTKASRWIAYTTIHPDQARQILDTSSRAQAKTNEILPHLQHKNTTTSTTTTKHKQIYSTKEAQRQTPLHRLFSTTSSSSTEDQQGDHLPPPSHQTPDLRQIVLHTKQIAHQPTKRTGLQQIAHQPTKRTGLLPTRAPPRATSDHGPLSAPCSRSSNPSCCSGQATTTHYATPHQLRIDPTQ